MNEGNGLPEMTAIGGIYKFTWANERVEMTIDRLRDHSDNLSAEILVRCTLPGVSPHLHHARQNLTSTTAKRTLIKALSEQVEEVNWSSLVEQACVLTLRKYREGEPVVMVGSMKVRGGVQYLLNPLLVNNEANLIYAPGGSNKSYLAILCAIMVQSGREHAGMKAHKGEVLYLDYETSQEEINERATLLQAGMKIALEDRITFLYRRCSQPVADDLDWIQRTVVDGGIKLVVVDSVRAALGVSQGEASESAIRYITALRALNVTSLSIDHTAKSELSEGPYGSVYKFNYARNIWEVKKQAKPGTNETVIGLYHKKNNNGPLLPNIGLKWTFHHDSVVVENTNLKEVPELAGPTTLKEKIKESLRSGKKTAKTLASEVDATDKVVSSVLSQNKDIFQSLGDTFWGLRSFDEES